MDRGCVNVSAPNLVNVCIDGAESQFYHGRLYHKYQLEPRLFKDVREMLRIMEELFDLCGYPQSSTQNRSFQDKKEKSTAKGASQVADMDYVLNQNGDLATFVVHVKYRQHSTWQGEVVWAEKNEKRTFRSALELLKLIDSALEDKNETVAEENREG